MSFEGLSAVGRRLRWIVTPAAPTNRRLWEGKLCPMQFRRTVPSDLEQCLELYRLNDGGRFPLGYISRYFKSLSEQESYVLVLDGPQGLIATGGLAYFSRRPNTAMLSWGLVHPAHHGKGIGTALLLARLALLGTTGLWRFVYIASLKDSVGYYRRFGFSTPGTLMWEDTSGKRHPIGMLWIFAYQIRRIRRILSEQGVTYPREDVTEIPYIDPLSPFYDPGSGNSD